MTTQSQPAENLSTLPFIKAHGTENDFVVLIDVDDQLEELGVLTQELVSSLCDRRAGIGGDGFLRVVRRSGDDDGDVEGGEGAKGRWFMDYRNADGSIAEMCGNGVRVFAHVLAAQGLETAREFEVDTRAGVKHITLSQSEGNTNHAEVSVGMGPVEVTGVSTGRVGEFSFAGLGVDVGNPHLAAVIPGMTAAALADFELTQPAFDHEFFPNGVNVELVTEPRPAEGSGVSDIEVSMRVWERGVGETRSCGTGTVAAARAALADAGIENGTVTVHVPGGTITVAITDGVATMTGPSMIVARGEVALNALK